MPEGTITASYGEHSKNVEDLVRALPAFMPSDPDSGNFDLLDVIGRGFDRLDEDIRDTDLAATLQDAQSIEEIERLAYPVGTAPKPDEPVDKYRMRVLGEFQTLTSEGTTADLLTNAATLLGVDPSKFTYEHLAPGHSSLKVPLTAMRNLPMSDAEFASILQGQSAAGYQMDITKSGTFAYLSPEDHAAGLIEPDAGYGGLDEDGEPKGNGGTYSGVL